MNIEKNICGECRFYCQHYSRTEHGCRNVYCGHCTAKQGGNKCINADCPACKAFVQIDHAKEEELKRIKITEVMEQIDDKLRRLLEYISND